MLVSEYGFQIVDPYSRIDLINVQYRSLNNHIILNPDDWRLRGHHITSQHVKCCLHLTHIPYSKFSFNEINFMLLSSNLKVITSIKAYEMA